MHKTVNALTAMGIFWVYFGIILIIASFFEEDVTGRWVNLVCALLFLLVGGVSFSRGRKTSSGL